MQMKRDVRSLTTKKLGRAVFPTVAILAILGVVAVGTLQAGPPPSSVRTFSITDPGGDQRGAIDVTTMVMTFNQKNGKYQIVLTADAAHPFSGQFRVNINVYNPSAPAANSLFSDNVNDYDLGSNTATSLTLKGGDQALKDWNAGNQVATNSYAGLENPPGVSLFRSAVNNFPLTPLTNEDMIGADDQSWDGVS
jgi:hypothetical protein